MGFWGFGVLGFWDFEAMKENMTAEGEEARKGLTLLSLLFLNRCLCLYLCFLGLALFFYSMYVC